jgi:hypothetical protein
VADLNKLVQDVQLHTGVTDPKFSAHIKTAIETAWAYLAALEEWWFMEQPDPYLISVLPGVFAYTIERDNVGVILHVANDKGRKIWVYKARRSFQAYLAFPTASGAVSSDSETSSNVGVFTLRGMKLGKPFIHVKPIPSVAQTAYLHYQEKGVLGNLDRLPDAWAKVLFHLTMSLMANPIEAPTAGDKLKWKAMTTAHEAQFRYALADMIRLELGSAEEEREVILDSYTAGRLEDINDC